MKLYFGGCAEKDVFNLVDPTAFNEPEFEAHVVRALTCAYPDYHCIPFRADFSFEQKIRRSDLAHVHRGLSHWFVIEVELLSHSFLGHVVPQVRCFRYGDPLPMCIDLLCAEIPDMQIERAQEFIQYVPRSVVVVTNRRNDEWTVGLRAHDAQILTLSIFQRQDGQIVHELDGNLSIVSENLGFFRYSAIDRTLKLPASTSDVDGLHVQIEDPFGTTGDWLIMRTEEAVWLRKQYGDPGMPHNELVQVLRISSGRLKLVMTSF